MTTESLKISPELLSNQPLQTIPSDFGLFEKDSLFGRIYNSLSANPYFSAGAGLVGIGVVGSLSKRFFILGNALFRRRFLSTLEIDNQDSIYPWVLDFVNKHSARRTNKITVNSLITQTESGRTSTSLFFLPGRGVHYFYYKYHWIKVERNRERHTIQKQGLRTALETVTLTALGGNPTFWKNFLHEATNEALANVETGLIIYNAVGPEWHNITGRPRAKRPLESIVLDVGISEKIQKDFEDFQKSHKWYAKRGIPYRRGYLLHGPPGTGKSSFITALAGYYGYSICSLSLSERTLDDDRLNRLLNMAPSSSFIVLEDVDAAMPSARHLFDNSKDKAYEGVSRLTLSGLLNAIDGVSSAEDRVLFMTTNHIECLDEALIRPGRVDLIQKLDKCTPFMLEKMFKQFYDNVSDSLCEEFRNKLTLLEKRFTPAQIQGHLLFYKENPRAAIDNIIDIKIMH